MQPQRHQLLGEPYVYYVSAPCALDQDLLAQDENGLGFLRLLDTLRRVFDLRIYAYRIESTAYHLVFRHHGELIEDDHQLMERWRLLGNRVNTTSIERLRERMSSLSGIMQTLAQRYSRSWHQRHGGRGSIWARRYRACLLTDDSALLCACSWLENEDSHEDHSIQNSRGHHSKRDNIVQLAPLPIRQGADFTAMPADEAPLGLRSSAYEDQQLLLDDFTGMIDRWSYKAYDRALKQGWAFGRSESLLAALARIGRDSGKGRSRQVRELDDNLGLCGVWG